MPPKAGLAIEAINIAILAFISLVVTVGAWVIARTCNRSQQQITEENTPELVVCGTSGTRHLHSNPEQPAAPREGCVQNVLSGLASVGRFFVLCHVAVSYTTRNDARHYLPKLRAVLESETDLLCPFRSEIPFFPEFGVALGCGFRVCPDRNSEVA
jgi:hypothetical protein